MADYHGSSGADTIDQVGQGLADGSNIFGEGGDDTIIVKSGVAVGGAGNDVLKGTSTAAGVAYWTSTAGVVVDLAKGVAQDGLGGTDTLSGFFSVQDSNYSDRITGSAADESFWLNGGADVVDGGAGYDTAVFYNRKSTDATITFDAATRTFTVQKRFPGGDNSTTVLTNVERIQFTGAESDLVTINAANYLPNGKAVLGTALTSLSLPNNAMQQLLVGDFTGDGRADLITPTIDYASNFNSASPFWLFGGDGQGGFVNASASLPAAAGGFYVARSLVGDFNEDGRPDVFILESGPDREPFPGGQNAVMLSGSGGRYTVSSAGLPQIKIFTHGGAVGDVNGDGHLDVVAFAIHAYSSHTPGQGPALQILLGDGKGGFTLDTADMPAYYQGTNYNPGNTMGALIDVNNDGKVDLIAGRWNESTRPSEVYLNDGKGYATIAPVALPASGVSHEAVMAVTPMDLNGDNLVDLAVSVTNGGPVGTPDFYTVAYIQLLINDGDGKFHDETQARLPQTAASPTASVPLYWYKTLQAVDVNGDGFKDMVVGVDTGGAGQGSRIFINDGAGKFTRLSVELPYLATALTDAAGKTYAFAASENNALKVFANDLPSTAPVTAAFANILREATPIPGHADLRSQLITGVGVGTLDGAQATGQLVKAAVATTSVATLNYQFFTGKIPSLGGIDYLIAPTGPNASNLNSAYYAQFNTVNRYINFAVNLGKYGDGKDSFAATYGQLSLFDATREAYKTIFGVTPDDAKVHALIDPRIDYLASYGGDGATGIGTKAAMVGWLLAAAATEDVGMYAKSNDAFLTDLADGATFAVNIVGTYGKPEYAVF
ncbi:FG-GAP-like repeat-containing protein [Caulobacter sp. 1776]|uniref:FG-GAP-like repeat-containing protein n=1 Tax=Caulobacter sp. 1776 TaxID=3156420 RepID=UPI003397849F